MTTQCNTNVLKSVAAAMALTAGLAAMPAASHAWGWYETPSAFRQYLAQRYYAVATKESQDWDIEDSLYLRNAQASVLHGNPIVPHPLQDVRIVSSRPGELQQAHDLLVMAGQNGAETKMPKAYANALAGFDCWVEQQEAESNAAHNMQYCKQLYLKYAPELATLQSSKVVVVEPQPMIQNLRTLHSVYFEWDKSALTADARAKLDNARAMLTDVRNGKLVINGFADASGPQGYNQALSEKRARTVANYLELPQDRFEIRVTGYGENYLHVPTNDGVKKPENRVVDISVDADRYVEPDANR